MSYQTALLLLCCAASAASQVTDVVRRPFDLEYRVNRRFTERDQRDVRTAVLQGGSVAVWTSDRADASSSAVVARMTREDGRLVGEEFIVNTYEEGEQREAAVAALTDGRFVIVWNSRGTSLRAQLYTVSGSGRNFAAARDGAEIVLAEDELVSVGPPEVAALPSGGFLVCYQTTARNDFTARVNHFQAYTAGGMPEGTGLRRPYTWVEGRGHGTHFAVTTYGNEGGFVAGQNFEVVSGQVKAGGVVEGRVVLTTEHRVHDVVVFEGTQEAVVAYSGSNGKVVTQRLSLQDGTAGESVRVSTAETEPGLHISLSKLQGGDGYTVAWTDDTTDGHDLLSANVYFQAFDVAGTTIGNTIRANTRTTNGLLGERGLQNRPTVASLPGQCFIVYWQSYNQDELISGEYGIFAQRFYLQ